MKQFLFASIVVASLQAQALTRFHITNEVSGLQFAPVGDVLGPMQPEWGLPSRELQCDQVPELEISRVIKRKMRETVAEIQAHQVTIPAHKETDIDTGEVIDAPEKVVDVEAQPAVVVEFCTLKDQFVIVEEDMAAEVAKEDTAKTEREAARVLAKKAGNLTTAEVSAAIKLLLKHQLGDAEAAKKLKAR
jgi:hypothetical protein